MLIILNHLSISKELKERMTTRQRHPRAVGRRKVSRKPESEKLL
jgi:hypothetical protein